MNLLWIPYRLKRTSPTAYCDCWEKCKCKTLIAGQKSARLDLLYRLLTATNLVTLPNSRQVEFLDGKSSAHVGTDVTLATCCVFQGRAPSAVPSADCGQADCGTLPVPAPTHQGGQEPENSQSWRWAHQHLCDRVQSSEVCLSDPLLPPFQIQICLITT